MVDEPNYSETICKISQSDMAAHRTLMAAERTLMAWVRTAMSFISFGFTMYKVLDAITGPWAKKIEALQSHHIGLLLMAMGTLPLALGMQRYYRTAKQYGESSREAIFNPSFMLAFLIVLLGTVLFFNLFFRWNLV